MRIILAIIVLVIVSVSCASAGTNSSPSAEKQGKWIIEYTISGGFAGIRRQLIINSIGHLTATDQKLKKKVEQQVSQKQLAEIINILEKLNYSLDTENSSKLSGRCTDCFQHKLILSVNGHKNIAEMDDIYLRDSKYTVLIKLLLQMLEQALKNYGDSK